jgi:hypothetical protein
VVAADVARSSSGVEARFLPGWASLRGASTRGATGELSGGS